jgi:hypothetical protein
MRGALGVIVVVLLASLLAACRPGSASAPDDAARVPADELTLGIQNGTSLDVALVVNGLLVGVYPASSGEEITAAQLPALPWDIEARTQAGRILAELTVREGDVWSRQNADGGTESNGVGVRVDLSCGRLDIWSGPPMIGPAPGPGSPGDCDP